MAPGARACQTPLAGLPSLCGPWSLSCFVATPTAARRGCQHHLGPVEVDDSSRPIWVEQARAGGRAASMRSERLDEHEQRQRQSAASRPSLPSPCRIVYSDALLAERAVRPDRVRPLRRVEYESLVEQGLLDDSRVELLLGTLIDMSPQGPLHASAVRYLAETFIRALTGDAHTRVQSPLALSDDSEPEPDLAVVPPGDYRRAHPTQALLVVEVSDTTLEKDRGVKTALYATAGIPEFWLVNLPDRVIEIHRQPSAGRYGAIESADMDAVIAPAAFPSLRVSVRHIFE
jgi:Uma2 family endonuclease